MAVEKPNAPVIAVIGGTGQVGRAACDHLRNLKQPFTMLSRQALEPSDSLVTTRFLDLDMSDTINTALAGVDRILLCSPDHQKLVERERLVF